MGFFSCPKKSDNHWWTESEWLSKKWTEKEIRINAALPHHMWGWKQNDRVWPMCQEYRGKNAFGPRAQTIFPPKYKSIPPKLVKGRGISRWISAEDKSILHVPMFQNYSRIWYPNNLPDIIEGFETQRNENYLKPIRFRRKDFVRLYGPSSLQKFSDRSYLVRDPYHISSHRMIKRREQLHVSKKETGEDTVWLWRFGWRFDSLDNYYVKKAVYVGWNWN